jgi:PhnB protein
MNLLFGILALTIPLALAEGSAIVTPAETSAAPRITPYIVFDGQCRNALDYYQEVLGGTVQMTSVGDSPMRSAFRAEDYDKIVHGRLRSPSADISCSDWLEPTIQPESGNIMRLYVTDGDEAATGVIFSSLAQGGEIIVDFDQTPFGIYGVLIDQFRVRWMFHVANAE